MARRDFLVAMLGIAGGTAYAVSSVNEQAVVTANGDRMLSLVLVDGTAPAVVSLDLGTDDTNIRYRSFTQLDMAGARSIRDGFEDVLLMAQEHHFSAGPLVLAVVDHQGRWRLQPLPDSKAKPLPISDMLVVKHLVSRGGRHLVAGVSQAGLPSVLVLDAVSGRKLAQWQAGAQEGEVSQLIRLSGSRVLALVNDRNRGAELVELSDRAQVVRRRTLPGGAASIAVASSGDILVAYRQDRQWLLTLLDRSWESRWTQPLIEAAGPGTRTLKLLSTSKGWMVAGGIQGKIFLQDLDASGQLGRREIDTSGQLPPSDSNWHALAVDQQPVFRGASRRKADLESAGMTEFLWMPR
jgi:hypothetical protein